MYGEWMKDFPIIVETKNHKITVVNYLNVDKIYRDLFEKLGV